MNADSSVKHSLLKYPTLFKNRIQVLIHYFAVIGNGMEWDKKGRLVSVCSKEPTKKAVDAMRMDFSDVHKDIKRYGDDIGKVPCLDHLNKAWLLNARFDLLRREFIYKNIDEVATNPLVLVGMKESLEGDYYLNNPCYNYARVFFVPENVTKDWARAVLDFVKFWQSGMAQKHQGFFGHQKERADPKTFTGEKKADWELVCRLREIENKMCVRLGLATQKEQAEIAKQVLDRLLNK